MSKKQTNYFLLTRRMLWLALVFSAVFTGFFSAFIFHTLTDLSQVRTLENYSPPTPTRILDINGRLISQFFAENRQLIAYDDIPPHLIEAILSTEDQLFFDHYGFNPWRIMKALAIDIIKMRAEQGGSTITIQLSKLLFLHHQKTITRKIKELWYAIQIERLYSKKEILYFYFNQVNFGHGCYGVQAAAQFFFNKDARDLDLAESALLAGIPKSPVYFSPLRRPDNAMRRHRSVLNNMVGQKIISLDEASEAYQNFWLQYSQKVRNKHATFGAQNKTEAPHFIEYLRSKLKVMFTPSQLYKGGLTVYTTLNLDHQRSAEEHLKTSLNVQNNIQRYRKQILENHFRRYVYDHINQWSTLYNMHSAQFNEQTILRKLNIILQQSTLDQLQDFGVLFGKLEIQQMMLEASKSMDNLDEEVEGAFISIEPDTGYITAMVGGSEFNYNNQFNRAMNAKRQLGSLMKPFIYAPAIDLGLITAGTIINDAPVAFGEEGSSNYYIPKNYSGTYRGNIPVRQALRKSVNIPAIKVFDLLGYRQAKEYNQRMFRVYNKSEVYEKFPPDATMALGSGVFSPFEVATALSTFANGGKSVVPLSIRFVTDRSGQVITNIENQYLGQSRQVISESAAYIMQDMLSGVFEPGGTAWNPALLNDFKHYRNSAGKTGTTSNWKDAWFGGFNPYLVAVVWVGYDSNKSLGRGRVGGNTSAPVWIKFMTDAINHKESLGFQKPNNVIVRNISGDTGKLASPGSENVYSEIFIKGTEPRSLDNSAYQKKQDQDNFLRIAKGYNFNNDISRFIKLTKEFEKNPTNTISLSNENSGEQSNTEGPSNN